MLIDGSGKHITVGGDLIFRFCVLKSAVTQVKGSEPKQRNALDIVFPKGGGTPGCRWGNWGLCGDFAAYLCPRCGGNEGPLIYYAPGYREIWGLCFS